MRVLVKGRIDSQIKSGGDILSIKDKIPHLKKLGIYITLDLIGKESVKFFDVVHLQQSIYNTYALYCHFREAEFYKKPVVYKPLYNPIKDVKPYMHYGQTKKVGMIYRLLNNHNSYIKLRDIFYSLHYKNFRTMKEKIFSDYSKMQIAILTKTYLIPDSHLEMNTINEEFNIKINHYSVVHNSLGINNELETISPLLFFNKYKITNFVLCAGRIEPLKNQINLLKALQGMNIQVVITGSTVLYHKKYINELKKLILNNSNFHWLGYINREMLFSAIKNAHVIAIPSWTEVSPALGIEGGYFDCNIATTEGGYGKEYFKENVWYLDPKDINSIRKAVLDAFDSPKGCNSFKSRIISEFSLEKTSQELYDSYCNAIKINNEYYS